MKRFKVTDILIGIVFTLLFISIGVVFTINFKPFYYMEINILNIEEFSGFPREEIIENYNALIDYSSPFYHGELSFPTFPASKQGIQHFEEVKDIFILFYIIGAITLIAAIIIVVWKKKKVDFSYLLVSSITSVVLPLIVGLLMAMDFDTTFLVFHQLFFKNDYWIFDSSTDPVIQILPAEFFLHSAILIIAFVIVGSLIMLLLYLRTKRNYGIRNRKIKGLKL